MFKKLKKKIGRNSLRYYKKRVQDRHDGSLEHVLSTVRKMLDRSKYCFLITNGEEKWPSARMVEPIIEEQSFVIWLGTNPELRKVREIRKNPYVTVAFGSERDNANLIIYGKAKIKKDTKERVKHWVSSWLLFFPKGPRGDDFVSIRIEPERMEVMNFKDYIVPEPFGLKPVKLEKRNGQWEILG